MIQDRSRGLKGASLSGVHCFWIALGVALTCCVAFPAVAAVPNDMFSGSFLLSGTSGTTNGSNVGATVEPGEPLHAGAAGGRSVWYRWTPAVSGPVVFDTIGSSFDTLLGIYIGASVSNLSVVASNDDILPAIVSQSRVTFAAIGGTTYRIAVDGFAGTNGAVVLNWTQSTGPPVNDNFSNATVINGSIGSTNGRSFNGTKEASEPNHAGNPGGSSIWYRWTAGISGPVTFNCLGSTFDTVMAVYTGSSLASLTQVAANDDATPSVVQSQVIFTASAGTVYRVAIDGYDGASGLVKLSWRYLSAPSFTMIKPTTMGQTQLALTGQVGDVYEVQESSDLVSWEVFLIVTNNNGTVQFLDTSSANNPARLYRARIQP